MLVVGIATLLIDHHFKELKVLSRALFLQSLQEFISSLWAQKVVVEVYQGLDEIKLLGVVIDEIQKNIGILHPREILAELHVELILGRNREEELLELLPLLAICVIIRIQRCFGLRRQDRSSF